MNDERLVERFEADRTRLHAVAYRLLGSASEADDAVQETWLRLSRADTSEVGNLSGWLTTVVARVCLDMLRSRSSRREESLGSEGESIRDAADPEREAVLRESVGIAMMAVLRRLSPAERVAFVLHDVFGVSFDEVAGIVGRSPTAARQLASRGRRRVQGASEDRSATSDDQHRSVVEAFFRASRAGDFQALLAILAPDVVVRPDAAALQMGTRNGWITSDLHGPDAVAQRFSGQAAGAQVALLDRVPGGVWMAGDRLIIAFVFRVSDGLVGGIDLVADQDRLAEMKVELLA